MVFTWRFTPSRPTSELNSDITSSRRSSRSSADFESITGSTARYDFCDTGRHTPYSRIICSMSSM